MRRYFFVGRGAMRGSIEWRTKRWGWATLWLPFARGGGMGLSLSPNATPWGATLLWGRRYEPSDRMLARVRRLLWGHGYSTAKHDPQKLIAYANVIGSHLPPDLTYLVPTEVPDVQIKPGAP